MKGLSHQVLAVGVLGVTAGLAGPAAPGPLEERIFRTINSPLGPAERPIRALMQLGNGLSSVGVPLVLVATRTASRQEALRVGVAGFGAWQLAKGVKRVVRRNRPNALLQGVQLRDGDPTGRGFVSGHAAVSMAIATAAAPALRPTARRGLFAAAIGTGLARVHVGAHLPLDVVGGAALGVLWGNTCRSTPRTAERLASEGAAA